MLSDAYTAKELAEIWGMAHKNVLERAASRNWKSRPRKGRGGGKEWIVADMDAESRTELARALAPRAAAPAPLPGGLEGAPERKRQRAQAKAHILNMARAFEATHGTSRTEAFSAFAALYNTGQINAPQWVRAARPHLCRQSLINWIGRAAKEGLAGLAGKHGQRRKGSGMLEQAPYKEFCLAFIHDYPHAGGVHLHSALEARFGKEPGARLPSLRSVQLWHKTFYERNRELIDNLRDPDMWRSHDQLALGNASALIVRLNQLWEEDSTKADLLLKDGKRYVIVGIIDVYSRRLRFHVSRTSSAHAVASCNRKCIMDWGVPEEAKTDNGSDYVGYAMQGLFLDLNILHTVCPPFSPEKKPHIERAFKTLLHDLFPLLQGYTGHNVAERKALEARKSFARRMFDKHENIELRLTPEELQKLCDDWTQGRYMHRPHEGLDGLTPFAKAQSWQGEIRRIEDARALDMLLLPVPGNKGIRQVSKKGLRLFGTRYIAREMGLYAKRDVLVRVDDMDIGRVYVFDPSSSKYLFTAYSPELSGLTLEEVKATATAAKQVQKTRLSQGRAEMRAASKKHNLADIAREILAADLAKAAAIEAAALAASSPAPVVEIHTSRALKEAARAARADRVPQPMPESPAEARTRRELEIMMNPDRVTTATPETPEERYRRARDMEESLARGYSFAPEDMRWLERYKGTTEYQARRDIEAFAASINSPAAAQA